MPAGPEQIVSFWRHAGPGAWFTKNDEFDARFRERFLELHETAARGELDHWMTTPEGSLALLILLDQFPRNAFRGTPRMFATDSHARRVAAAAIAAGHDRAVEERLQMFFYLPLEHSENAADQELSVALTRRLGQEAFKYAELHRDIIKRFGRFPHRNAILGRATTPQEQAYLGGGGFKG
jgi:uncharacterized protein (DUF924 family)